MSRAAVFLLMLLTGAVPARAALVLLDTYLAGGTLHLVLRNDGATPAEIAPGALRRQADGFEVPRWWAHAAPATIAPGALGLARVGLRRPEPPRGPHTIDFGGEAQPFDLDAAPRTMALEVTHLLTNPDAREAALFVENLSGEDLRGVAVELGGAPAALDAARSHAAIHPCDTGVLVLTGCPPLAPEYPLVVALTLEGAGGEARHVYRHAVPFVAPLFRVRTGEAPSAFTCPTHRHGPWSDAARAILAQPVPPEVHFCRNRAHEGIAALAQLAPRAIVNLQGSNRARGLSSAWAGLREFTAYAVARTAPGVVSALIEPHSNFDGSFAQPAAQAVDPLTPRDLQYTVFAALAGGCKGLVFRDDASASAEYRDLAAQLAARIHAAAPWMETVAPVSLGAHASDPGVVVTTLYTGTRGALVIALRNAPGDTATPLTVTLDLPPWFTPTHRVSLAGPGEPVRIEPGAGRVTLEFDAFRDLAAELLHVAP